MRFSYLFYVSLHVLFLHESSVTQALQLSEEVVQGNCQSRNSTGTSPPQRYQWPLNTFNGTKLLFTFIDYANQSVIEALPKDQYTFVWGGGSVTKQQFRESGHENVVVSKYIPFSRDAGPHNLTYWQENEPSWILYKCDRKTPAYFGTDPNIPFDIANPEVIKYQLDHYVLPAYTSGEFDGMAMDNLALENGQQGCGVWTNPNGRNSTPVWKQLYSGEFDDPVYEAAVVNWMKSFWCGVHEVTNQTKKFFVTVNFSLGPKNWTDPSIQTISSHVDGILSEAGWTDYGSRFFGGENWKQRTHWIAEGLQPLGVSYFSNNEWGHHFKGEFTREQRIFMLASYLTSKGNSSSITYSPIQKYGYPVEDWLFNSYDTGYPLEPMFSISDDGIYFRFFSGGGIAAFNPTKSSSMNFSRILSSIAPSGFCPSESYVDPWGAQVSPKGFVLKSDEGLVWRCKEES